MSLLSPGAVELLWFGASVTDGARLFEGFALVVMAADCFRLLATNAAFCWAVILDALLVAEELELGPDVAVNFVDRGFAYSWLVFTNRFGLGFRFSFTLESAKTAARAVLSVFLLLLAEELTVAAALLPIIRLLCRRFCSLLSSIFGPPPLDGANAGVGCGPCWRPAILRAW